MAELVPHAPGLRALRPQPGARRAGYIVGAQMFNLIAAELVFAAIFVGVLLVTLPEPPWDLLQYGGMALVLILPLVFYPFSKTLFLAFDLVFRPPAPEDFVPRA